jgi:streptomycin 6-kinase
MLKPPQDILRRYDLTLVQHVTTTSIADIWKVARVDGTFAALKIYHDQNPQDEAPGFALMQAAKGQGCVPVLDYSDGIALMGWLEGPLAGALSRTGQDKQALNALIGACKAMHSAVAPAALPDLKTTDDCLQELFELQYAPDCSVQTRQLFAHAQRLARALASTQSTLRPLHGDLHHDNVILSPNGPLMFDAKGIRGEPAYEASNMFCNPIGSCALIRDPARARWMADELAPVFATTPLRLLQWAAVRIALSIVWDVKSPLPASPKGGDLLALYLSFTDV